MNGFYFLAWLFSMAAAASAAYGFARQRFWTRSDPGVVGLVEAYRQGFVCGRMVKPDCCGFVTFNVSTNDALYAVRFVPGTTEDPLAPATRDLTITRKDPAFKR